MIGLVRSVVGIPGRISRWFGARSPARRLLDAELDTAGVRVATVRSILDEEGANLAAANNAQTLLRRAETALESGDTTYARHSYYAAIRWETVALAQLEELDLFDGTIHARTAADVLDDGAEADAVPPVAVPDAPTAPVSDGGRLVAEPGRRGPALAGGVMAWLRRLVSGTRGPPTDAPSESHPDQSVASATTGPTDSAQRGSVPRPADNNGSINPYVSAMNPLQLRVDRLRYEARVSLSSWRRRAVLDLLEDDNGVPKQSVTLEELLAALKLLHEYYIGRELRLRTLRTQLTYFVLIAFTTVFAILAIAQPPPAFEGRSVLLTWFSNLLLGLVGVVPLGFGAGIPPFDPASLAEPGYLAFVVLFGVLGAAVSGILPLTSELRSQRLPEGAATFRLAVARVAMGGAAALAVFAFLQSGLLDLGGLTPGLVLAVSFAAGFSERLVVRAVESVTRQQVDEKPGG